MDRKLTKKELEDKVKMYELSVIELRSTYDRLNDLYSDRRSRALLILGGGFALLSYLFSNGDFIKKTFLSSNIAIVIFSFLGIGLFVRALTSLFIVTRPVEWYIPTDYKDLKKMEFKDYLEFLKYFSEEYSTVLKNNTQHHEEKQKLFDFGSFLLIIGAVILIVIKEFN